MMNTDSSATSAATSVAGDSLRLLQPDDWHLHLRDGAGGVGLSWRAARCDCPARDRRRMLLHMLCP